MIDAISAFILRSEYIIPSSALENHKLTLPDIIAHIAIRTLPYVGLYLVATNLENPFKEKTFNKGVDLIAKFQKEPIMVSLKGRESELEQLKAAIGTKETPNVMLVGPPGCGKTTMVEAWANEIAQNTDPAYPFKDTVIISISPTDFTAGASLIGITEQRVQEFIDYGKNHPNVIYFIDEFHGIMHNGGFTSNQIPNMLKQALSNGDIRIIGCTTAQELGIIEKDKAFARRFSVINFEAPSIEMIQEIIQTKVKFSYEKHHQVCYDEEAIREAFEFSEYLPGNDPAKTLSLLDMAGSLAHIRGLKTVTRAILLECAIMKQNCIS